MEIKLVIIIIILQINETFSKKENLVKAQPYFISENKTYWAEKMQLWINFVEAYQEHMDTTLYFAAFVAKSNVELY